MIPNIENILINNTSCVLLYEHHVVDGGILSESRSRGFASSTLSTLASYGTGTPIPQSNYLVTASGNYWRNVAVSTETIGSIVGNNTIRFSVSGNRSATWDKPGKQIRITGSTNNNGLYNVVSASYTGSPLRVQIIVEETTLVGSGTMGSVTWDDPLAFGTGDFTAECLCYPIYNSTYPYRSVYGNLYSAGICLEMDYGVSTWNFTYYTGGSVHGVSVALPYNDWYHILSVRKNGVIKHWINGVLIYSAANTSNVTTSAGNTFVMGADASGVNTVSSIYYFNGRIARCAVWKGAAYWHESTTINQKCFDTNLVLRMKGQKTNRT